MYTHIHALTYFIQIKRLKVLIYILYEVLLMATPGKRTDTDSRVGFLCDTVWNSFVGSHSELYFVAFMWKAHEMNQQTCYIFIELKWLKHLKAQRINA